MTLVIFIMMALGIGGVSALLFFVFLSRKMLQTTKSVAKLSDDLLKARALELSIEDEFQRLTNYKRRFLKEHSRLRALPNREDLVDKYDSEIVELNQQLQAFEQIAVLSFKDRHLKEMQHIVGSLKDKEVMKWTHMSISHFNPDEVRQALRQLPYHQKKAQKSYRQICAYRLPQQHSIIAPEVWGDVYTELVQCRDEHRQNIQAVIDNLELISDRLHYIQGRLERIDTDADWHGQHESLRGQIGELSTPTREGIQVDSSLIELESMEQQIQEIEGTLETHRRITMFLEHTQTTFPEQKE